MQLLTRRNLFTLLLFALVMMFILVGSTYPPRAAFGPLLIGIPLAVLILILIWSDSRKKAKGHDKQETMEDKEENPSRSYWDSILWTIGFLIFGYFFPLVATFPLFTLAYIKVKGFSWLLSITVTLCVFIVLYVVFGMVLKAQLYKGSIFE